MRATSSPHVAHRAPLVRLALNLREARSLRANVRLHVPVAPARRQRLAESRDPLANGVPRLFIEIHGDLVVEPVQLPVRLSHISLLQQAEDARQLNVAPLRI